MVASFDATVLRTVGVKIVQELWANDISAEIAVDASSLEELTTRYKDDNHSWIVIVKQDSTERGLKVKSIVRKEDFEVRGSELVNLLRNEIRARNQRENMAEPTRPKISTQESSSSARERLPDVRVLTAQHKSKKTNRRNIIEAGSLLFSLNFDSIRSFGACLLTNYAALLRSREVVDRSLDGPIAAIDTRDDVLESLRETRLSDPDSWRTVIQNAPLTERKYLGFVHEMLSDFANESKDPETGQGKYSNAFIYNYRTGSCIYYDLGRPNDK